MCFEVVRDIRARHADATSGLTRLGAVLGTEDLSAGVILAFLERDGHLQGELAIRFDARQAGLFSSHAALL